MRASILLDLRNPVKREAIDIEEAQRQILKFEHDDNDVLDFKLVLEEYIPDAEDCFECERFEECRMEEKRDCDKVLVRRVRIYANCSDRGVAYAILLRATIVFDCKRCAMWLDDKLVEIFAR